MVEKYPPFSLGRSQFDRSTYSGRFRYFINVINPISLAKTETEIRAAENLLTRSRDEANGGIVQGSTNTGFYETLV